MPWPAARRPKGPHPVGAAAIRRTFDQRPKRPFRQWAASDHLRKLAPIALFIVLVAVTFDMPKFSFGFWGRRTPDLGSIVAQLKSAMPVTLCVFIGTERASVVSGRAAKRADIGRATIIGFVIALSVYLLVSLLSYGLMSQAELAGLPAAASMANALEQAVGPWGSVVVRIGLVVPVAGAFLSWTVFAAEIPCRAAKEGMLPAVFATEDKNGSPAGALWITNIFVQIFLIVTLYENSTYLALFYIASTATLVPYVLSGAYAFRLALGGEGYKAGERRGRDMFYGGLATVCGAWLVCAAGPAYLLMCAILCAASVPICWYARAKSGEKPFSGVEDWIGIGIVVAAIVAAYQMWTGAISAL